MMTALTHDRISKTMSAEQRAAYNEIPLWLPILAWESSGEKRMRFIKWAGADK